MISTEKRSARLVSLEQFRPVLSTCLEFLLGLQWADWDLSLGEGFEIGQFVEGYDAVHVFDGHGSESIAAVLQPFAVLEQFGFGMRGFLVAQDLVFALLIDQALVVANAALSVLGYPAFDAAESAAEPQPALHPKPVAILRGHLVDNWRAITGQIQSCGNDCKSISIFAHPVIFSTY